MARIMRQPRRGALLGALVALAAILFVAWTAVSANAGAVTATISDDADATRCGNEIRSDSTCDLILRVFNTTSGERTWTLDKILVDKAFDASTITPQTGTPGETKTLGQCPCQYPIAAGATQTYKIHIEVGALRDGYTSGKINVYPRAQGDSQFPGRTIASYQLDIEIATSITIGTVTDTTIDLSWVGNAFVSRTFIFWWPEGSAFESVKPMTTKASTYTITGLTPATKYQVRVQPYKGLARYQAKQVEVTTKASATPTPRPVTVDDCSETVTIGSNAQDLKLVLTDNTSASYCVTLSVDPGGETTVRLELEGGQVSWSRVKFSTNGAADKSDAPPTLTFDSSNWQTPQVVTVHGVPDESRKGQTYQLTHTASGSASGTTLRVIVVDENYFFSTRYRCYNNICDQGVSQLESVIKGLRITEATSTTCADDDYASYQIRMSGIWPLVHNLDYLTVNPFNGQQIPRNFSRIVDGKSVKLKQPLHFQYQAPGETDWNDIPEGGFRVLREHWGSEHWTTPVDKANSSGWYGVRVCAPLETRINSPDTFEILIWLDPTQFGKPRHSYGLAEIWVTDNGME